MFTLGNVDDHEPLKQGKFLENIKGKLCADKGNIRQVCLKISFLTVFGLLPVSYTHLTLPTNREV